ncbi:hypothetical protein CJF42_22320 [Pseudoalteromonas sp. NBT06-2]|nr:hypothetical protein CJF42_22320 [Pseudoalteromonas sp. NBT06-2]
MLQLIYHDEYKTLKKVYVLNEAAISIRSILDLYIFKLKLSTCRRNLPTEMNVSPEIPLFSGVFICVNNGHLYILRWIAILPPMQYSKITGG